MDEVRDRSVNLLAQSGGCRNLTSNLFDLFWRQILTAAWYGFNMSNEPRAPRLAVLIDADNASSRIATRLFEEIAKIGEASVRRIYGDFSGTRLKSWAEVLSTHAIRAQQNFAYTTGKNASDIALVIDAMDLLHTGRFDAFCLVSSDSDFTGLAARIREQGIDVYGFGEQKTPESFRQACRRFIYTENFFRRRRRRKSPNAPICVLRQPNKPQARPPRLFARPSRSWTMTVAGFPWAEWASVSLNSRRISIRVPMVRPSSAIS